MCLKELNTSRTDTVLQQIDSRGQDSFNYSREILITWGVLDTVLDWCRQELAYDWRWQLIDANTQQPGHYVFYFDNERDFLAFVMKWS